MLNGLSSEFGIFCPNQAAADTASAIFGTVCQKLRRKFDWNPELLHFPLACVFAAKGERTLKRGRHLPPPPPEGGWGPEENIETELNSTELTGTELTRSQNETMELSWN